MKAGLGVDEPGLCCVLWVLVFILVTVAAQHRSPNFRRGGSSALLIAVITAIFLQRNLSGFVYPQKIWGGSLGICVRGWPLNLLTFQNHAFHDDSEGRWVSKALPWLNGAIAVFSMVVCRALWWRLVLRRAFACPAPPRFQFRLATLLALSIAAGLLMAYFFSQQGRRDCEFEFEFNTLGSVLLTAQSTSHVLDAFISVGVLCLVFVAAEARERIPNHKSQITNGQ